jgi:hypothetical protein
MLQFVFQKFAKEYPFSINDFQSFYSPVKSALYTNQQLLTYQTDEYIRQYMFLSGREAITPTLRTQAHELVDEIHQLRAEELTHSLERDDGQVFRKIQEAINDERYDINHFYAILGGKNARRDVAGDWKLGSKHISQWYDIYTALWNAQHGRRALPREHPAQPQLDVMGRTIPYPFRSKIAKYKQKHPDVVYEEQPVATKVNKKLLQRPSFSNRHDAWQIDIVSNLITQGDMFFFCMNMNTRYLIVAKISHKSSEWVLKRLQQIMTHLANLSAKMTEEMKVPIHHTIRYITGDGEKGFNSILLKNWYEANKITAYFNPSKFTYHNKLIDVVIKTIRDAIGYRRISVQQLSDIVSYYNNTYHTSIDCTPLEMMKHPEWEDQYIRYCLKRLSKAEQHQQQAKLLNYQAGDVLLIHLDLSKTADGMQKRRKFWNRIGTFVEYDHGNVRVALEYPVRTANQTLTHDVIVPVYFTKMVARAGQEIPQEIQANYPFEPT